MPVPSPRTPGPVRPHEVRRLRDLLRAAIGGGRFPAGRLPSEGELMIGFGATRSGVREALALLRDEGLLRADRRSVVAHPRIRSVGPVGGTAGRARMLDRAGIPAPAPLAAWLGVPVGSPCLRIELVTVAGGVPSGVATHYVPQPEAGELLGLPMRDDWQTLLDDAGFTGGRTETEVDHLPADPAVAELLGVPAGTTLLAVEQTTTGADGRVFDAAVLRLRVGAGAVHAAGERTASIRPAPAGALSGR